MSKDHTAYDASHIVVLEWPEVVRRRPGMYIGSTGERGLHHLVFELAGWVLERGLGGPVHPVEITLAADGCVRVAEHGTDRRSGTEEEAALEDRLTRFHCGGAGAGRRLLLGPSFGTEPAVVNALSERLTAEVWRDGACRVLGYERGVAVAVPVARGAGERPGTVITFRPDGEVFETVEFSFEVLAGRFRELAFLYRELDITLTDERGSAAPRSLRFHFPGGPRDHIAGLGAPVHPDVFGFERECPEMEGTVEVALRWCEPGAEQVVSYANSHPTTEGGAHELGFREGLAAAVTAQARERLLLAPTDPGFTCAQLGAGLTAVVSVKLDRPWFEGATRGRLGNEPVRGCVADAVREELTAWLRADGARATAILGRIVAAARR
ncbi:DNA gyrase subunit B [Kitasatospora sp. MMS16-BH015]|uniref:DNA gyrase subunit B n=1 Tax=Kitasatospora sp. MMS16-BH015 TaxID=2018025 RepID=UPI000CA24811|nr:DNA gyrase subunit B [Kitasatospora sp. MMS16-BH015]AUG75231.1 DNA gyrase subunit B [Kitasatospora sp. MMS16-BH015]